MIGMAGEIFTRLCAMNKAKAEELQGMHEDDNDWSRTPLDDNLAPHMLIAADLYEERADRLRNEAEHLEKLACDARTQAENLSRMANL